MVGLCKSHFLSQNASVYIHLTFRIHMNYRFIKITYRLRKIFFPAGGEKLFLDIRINQDRSEGEKKIKGANIKKRRMMPSLRKKKFFQTHKRQEYESGTFCQFAFASSSLNKNFFPPRKKKKVKILQLGMDESPREKKKGLSFS